MRASEVVLEFKRLLFKRERFTFLAFAICAVAAMLPISLWFMDLSAHKLPLLIIFILNLLGWGLVAILLFSRVVVRGAAEDLAREMGLREVAKTTEEVVKEILAEVARKNKALTFNAIDAKVETSQALSAALEKIVALSYRAFKAESAELALFDVDSATYHSSFVMGKPFQNSAQATFSGILDGEEDEISPSVMVHPISFAGSVLGSLRVGLPDGRLPSTGDREIMRILALQSSMAMINSEYTAELVRMKKVSEETVRAKTGFLANLSHEIRGPLGLMLNAVELVLDGLCGEINADQEETLQMVQSNGQHLLDLINDVLDYAKVESGKVTPKKEELLVSAIVQDILKVVRTQAESKGHTLEFVEPTDVYAISCDKRHLRQMLINLLTNAIKYTPENGKIVLAVSRVPGNRVRISVRDNGVGIEESQRVKVFSAFERVEHSYSLTQLGTGLGMPLTRRLAEVNGAQIDFESSPGSGSEFWLQFPTISYDVAQHNPSVNDQPEASGVGESILLFGSESKELDMMRKYLSHIGFNLVMTSRREEAFMALQQGKVELVLFDTEVLEDSNTEDIERFRKAAGSAFLPLVVLTSRAFAFDIEKYLKDGIDLCLIKPIALKDLGRICRNLIDGKPVGSSDHTLTTV